MKKLLVLIVFLVGVFTLTSIFTEAATPTFDVSVNARFDNENTGVGTGLTAQAYGTKVTLDSNLPADPGGDTYQFAFWIVNGVARYELAQNHEFIITGDMNIEAVYSKSTEHAAIFMDTNGKVLDTQYVTNGGDANEDAFLIAAGTYTETFDSFSAGSYADDTPFDGVTGLEWTHSDATTANSGDSIDGKSVQLSGTGHLEFTTDKPINNISVDYSKPYSGDSQISILVDGSIIGTSDLLTIADTPQTFTLDNLTINEGSVIKIQSDVAQVIVDNFAWSTDASYDYPSKPSFVVNETTTWNAPLTNITDDQIFILQYEIDSSTQYTVTVNNGSGDGPYTYNDEVTLTPDSLVDFSHWEVNGEIVSFDETYKFTALSDITVDAVNQASPEAETPLIVLSSDLALRTGYESYVGQFYFPDGYTLVDYGIIASDTDEPITLETEGITRYQGFKYNGSTNEFLMSLGTSHTLLRGYLVLDNGTDYEFFYTTYTDTINPVISGVPASASINEGDTYDEVTGITASDNVDGDITGDIMISVTDSLDNPVTYTDFSGLAADTYTITYSVTDSSGNTNSENTELTILPSGNYIQGDLYTQDFSAITSTSSTYSYSEQFTDSYGFGWDILGRPGGATGFGLGNEADGSYIEVQSTTGIESISIEIVRMFTNTNTRTVELFINNTSYGTFDVDVNSDTSQLFTVNDIDIAGDVTIRLESQSPGSRGAMDVIEINWYGYVLEE